MLTSIHLTLGTEQSTVRIYGLILSDRKILVFTEPWIHWKRYIHEMKAWLLGKNSQDEMVLKQNYLKWTTFDLTI